MAAERTFHRERFEQPLRITYAADLRRLSRRWAGRAQGEMQLHYHRVAVRWLARRAHRMGLVPIARSEHTTISNGPDLATIQGRVQLIAWAAEDLAGPPPDELGRRTILADPGGPERIRVGFLEDGAIAYIQAVVERAEPT